MKNETGTRYLLLMLKGICSASGRVLIQVNMEQTNRDNKIRLLLDLVLKLNDTFLQASDLDDVLNAVLVGITAGEGLGFNRAFLFKLQDYEEGGRLEAVKAIGPASAEEAAQVWNEISERQLSLFDIMLNMKVRARSGDEPLIDLVREISVPIDDVEHVFIASIREHAALHVRREDHSTFRGVSSLCEALNAGEFAVVPLVTHQRPFGVVVADNFITGAPVFETDLEALHLFAGLGSIAICQANMCSLMEERIVDLQRLNAEVIRNRGLLIHAERQSALGRMADQLLHQLRNPLSAIGGMAGLLAKRTGGDPVVKKYTGSIISQCVRMERTLDEVFELFHTPDVKYEDVKLYQLISASVGIFDHELRRLKIISRLDLPAPEPVIRLDRTYFQQALVNVIKNAIEAMPDGGRLDVSVEHGDALVTIKVIDSGLGIARGHLNRLDEPFFTTKSHAMGVGLSLGKKVLEQHGGTLSIEQNSCGGATVILSIPLDNSRHDHSRHDNSREDTQ